MEENDRQQKEGAKQQEEWAKKGILGKCPTCGRLVARTEAKQEALPIGPGWDQVFYYCPDCFTSESGWGALSTTGLLRGVDGERVTERVPTGRDFI
jgi:hypothetical protein